MKFHYILLLTLFLLESSSASCRIIDDDVPSCYADVLADKVKLINSDSPSVPSFIFITDTHANANRMVSPFLIRKILEQTNISKVIWGGDALCAFGQNSDIDVQWKKQLLFDSLVSQTGQIYKIRGNHDFTIKESKTSNKGVTYSQQKTAQLLFENRPDDLVRNDADPGACYYFFDDKLHHVRFIAFDTTDSVKGEDMAWGTIYGVNDVQLRWITDSAIATTPKGYGLVFLSHVPFTDTTGARHVVLSNVREIVDAAALKTSGTIRSVDYDFTKLKDVKVLMCLSGHNHQDMQTYRNGVVHTVTASDAAYDDYKADPFVKDLTGRKKETVNEHCFDCVTINKKKELIKMYRIGVGGDRVFHTKPLLYRIGKRKRLKTSLRDNVEWHSYNASGNKYDGKWTLFNDIVSVDNHGNVRCQKIGESVVLAVDKKGNKEFYNIIVKM
jgi:hypothetical protein